MWDALKALIKQPYWIIILILGAVMMTLPCVTIDKDHRWATHPPRRLLLAATGAALLLFSALIYWKKHVSAESSEADLDLTRVKESKGEMWTTVSGCEIRVAEGQVQDFAAAPGVTIVLPCNEYFDDRCVEDTRSALGAYANHVFEGQVAAFVALVKDECRKSLAKETCRKRPMTRAPKVMALVDAFCCSSRWDVRRR